MNDLCASNVSVDGLGYSCCGKVNIRNDWRLMIDYVVNEPEDVFGIQMEDDSGEVVTRPMFNESAGTYNYENAKITKYWPVRFLIDGSGKCSLTLNRIAFDENNKIVQRVI